MGTCLQLLPRFVMDIFVEYPGVPGLFVASLFSGALRWIFLLYQAWSYFYDVSKLSYLVVIHVWYLLQAVFVCVCDVSSVSSMLNSLSAVLWEDFCKLCVCSQNTSDARATTYNKLFGMMSFADRLFLLCTYMYMYVNVQTCIFYRIALEVRTHGSQLVFEYAIASKCILFLIILYTCHNATSDATSRAK